MRLFYDVAVNENCSSKLFSFMIRPYCLAFMLSRMCGFLVTAFG